MQATTARTDKVLFSRVPLKAARISGIPLDDLDPIPVCPEFVRGKSTMTPTHYMIMQHMRDCLLSNLQRVWIDVYALVTRYLASKVESLTATTTVPAERIKEILQGNHAPSRSVWDALVKFATEGYKMPFVCDIACLEGLPLEAIQLGDALDFENPVSLEVLEETVLSKKHYETHLFPWMSEWTQAEKYIDKTKSEEEDATREANLVATNLKLSTDYISRRLRDIASLTVDFSKLQCFLIEFAGLKPLDSEVSRPVLYTGTNPTLDDKHETDMVLKWLPRERIMHELLRVPEDESRAEFGLVDALIRGTDPRSGEVEVAMRRNLSPLQSIVGGDTQCLIEQLYNEAREMNKDPLFAKGERIYFDPYGMVSDDSLTILLEGVQMATIGALRALCTLELEASETGKYPDETAITAASFIRDVARRMAVLLLFSTGVYCIRKKSTKDIVLECPIEPQWGGEWMAALSRFVRGSDTDREDNFPLCAVFTRLNGILEMPFKQFFEDKSDELTAKVEKLGMHTAVLTRIGQLLEVKVRLMQYRDIKEL